MFVCIGKFNTDSGVKKQKKKKTSIRVVHNPSSSGPAPYNVRRCLMYTCWNDGHRRAGRSRRLCRICHRCTLLRVSGGSALRSGAGFRARLFGENRRWDTGRVHRAGPHLLRAMTTCVTLFRDNDARARRICPYMGAPKVAGEIFYSQLLSSRFFFFFLQPSVFFAPYSARADVVSSHIIIIIVLELPFRTGAKPLFRSKARAKVSYGLPVTYEYNVWAVQSFHSVIAQII